MKELKSLFELPKIKDKEEARKIIKGTVYGLIFYIIMLMLGMSINFIEIFLGKTLFVPSVFTGLVILVLSLALTAWNMYKKRRLYTMIAIGIWVIIGLIQMPGFSSWAAGVFYIQGVLGIGEGFIKIMHAQMYMR